MECEKKIDLPDGKALYYVHTASGQKNQKVIVHIHGLSGWPYEVASTDMARQFPDQGYDVVRPYLYHWLDDARKLHETTIAISATDIEVLISELQKTYSKIFVAGHSYGGPIAMMLDQTNVTAVSLWDPSYDPSVLYKPEWMEHRENVFLFKGYFYFLMESAMVEEGKSCNIDWARARARQWQRPLQVIHAANGSWVKYSDGESFHSYAAGKTDYHVIAGTVHCFVESDTSQQLLSRVKTWFDRF